MDRKRPGSGQEETRNRYTCLAQTGILDTGWEDKEQIGGEGGRKRKERLCFIENVGRSGPSYWETAKGREVVDYTLGCLTTTRCT